MTTKQWVKHIRKLHDAADWKTLDSVEQANKGRCCVCQQVDAITRDGSRFCTKHRITARKVSPWK